MKIKKSLLSKWLSIVEAATFLGVSKDTLRRWEKKGKLTARRTVGGHRRYSRKQLEILLRQPISQIFETELKINEIKPLLSQQLTSTSQLRPPKINKKYKHISISLENLFSSNLASFTLVVLIVLLLLASIYLLQIARSQEQPPSLLSPIPLTNNLQLPSNILEAPLRLDRSGILNINYVKPTRMRAEIRRPVRLGWKRNSPDFEFRYPSAT